MSMDSASVMLSAEIGAEFTYFVFLVCTLTWRLLTSSGCGHAGSAECIKEKPWRMSRCRTKC